MNTNDPVLEQRLRAWYRDEVERVVRAPEALRASVAAIPHSMPLPKRRSDRGRLTLLVAAALFALAGGAAVVGYLSTPHEAAVVVPPSPDATPTVASPTVSPSPHPSGAPPPTPAATPTFASVEARPVPAAWHSAGSMATGRVAHTAALLTDGRVLIAGGWSSDEQALASAELWDPAARAFTTTGSMHTARVSAAATLLLDGRVFVVGGDGRDGAAADAEVWDPATGTFTTIGPTPDRRGPGVTATTMPDGRVLIVGGVACVRAERSTDCGDRRATVLWDPSTSLFAQGPRLIEDRDWPTATLLPDGRVLVVAGTGLGIDTPEGAEAWGPDRAAFEAVGAPRQYRSGNLSVTLLSDGRVLIVGGETGDLKRDDGWFGPLGSAELWDPATRSFTASGTMATVRSGHQAGLLADGQVIVVGGSAIRTSDFRDGGLKTTEIWDRSDGTFHDGPSMAEGRRGFTLTRLRDGSFVAVGGASGFDKGAVVKALTTAEILAPDMP